MRGARASEGRAPAGGECAELLTYIAMLNVPSALLTASVDSTAAVACCAACCATSVAEATNEHLDEEAIYRGRRFDIKWHRRPST